MDSGCSFYVDDGTGTNTFGATRTLNIDSFPTRSFSFQILYRGTGDGRLTFTIRYTRDEPGAVEESLYFSELIIPKLNPPDDDGFYVPPKDSTQKSPYLSVVPEYSIPILLAGSPNKISIPIKNYGQYTAKNITVSVDLGTTPAKAHTLGLKYQIKEIPIQSTEKIALNLDVDAGAKEGIYTMTLTYSYANEDNATFSGSDTINIRVVNNNSRPRVMLASFAYGGQPIKGGQVFDLTLDLANAGGTSAKEVLVTLVGLSADKLALNNSTDNRYLVKIDGGTTAKVTFPLVAAQRLSSESAELAVRIEYLDAQSEKISAENKVFIPLDGTAGAGSVPKLIVSQYSLSPETALAGKTITFTFGVKNTSRDQAVSNLKVSVMSDEGIFTVKNGSNTFFVENIAPQGIYTKSLALEVKNSAVSKAYPLKISFEYEDAKGTAQIASESISINVEQETRLSFGQLNIAPMAMAGMPTQVFIQYYNLGKTTLNNLMIDVEGGRLPEGAYFVGNMGGGRSDYFEDQVVFEIPGLIEGALVFTFEDDTGTEIVKKVPFEIMVQEMVFPENPDMSGDLIGRPDKNMPSRGSNGSGPWIWIAIGIVVPAAGIAAFVITRKIKARRLEENETV